MTMKKSSYNIGYILFLAVVAACGGFLFGYDTAVISGTIKQVTTLFGLNDIEQGWYVGCALVGSIAGVAVAGTMSDWIGRRLTMISRRLCFRFRPLAVHCVEVINGLFFIVLSVE